MPLEVPFLSVLAALIEFGGALILVARAIAALDLLLRRGGTIEHARIVVVEGALASLNFKLAATLLKTIELRSADQIAAFAAVLALRTLLKTVLGRERRRLGTSGG